MNGGKLIFTTCRKQRAAFLTDMSRMRAAQFFPKEGSKIGAVYIAKVKNMVKNLDACFAEIGGEHKEIVFLTKKDCAYPFLLNRKWDGRILEGDEFPVQIKRDAQKTKQASATTLISLSNEYFALNIGNTHTGFSNKISDKERKHLRNILKRNSCLIPQPISGVDLTLPVGLVVRTRCAECLSEHSNAEEILLNSLTELTERFEQIFNNACHRTCFSCLLKPPEPWEDALSHLAYPWEYDEILTDDPELFNILSNSKLIPNGKSLRLYSEREQETLPLEKLYSIEHKLETALERRVWLKSGGYLIIDITEALTVIDVNSGKHEASKTSRETYMRINKEAAAEIALQLRLRNLSGIIIVDFINMKSVSDQEELINCLTTLTASDPQKTTVVDMTQLGLVEITRKKSSRPLIEQIKQNGEHYGL